MTVSEVAGEKPADPERAELVAKILESRRKVAANNAHRRQKQKTEWEKILAEDPYAWACGYCYASTTGAQGEARR